MNVVRAIFLFFFLTFTCIGQSQETENKFGIKVGVNFGNIASGQFNTREIPRTGVLVGLVSEFAITNQIAFAPELVYSNQGSLRRFDENGANFINRSNINYMALC